MNAITEVRSTAVALPSIPKPSMRLDHAIGEIENPHPDCQRVSAWPAPLKAEAAALVEALEAHCQPVTLDGLKAWAGPLRAAVRNPPGDNDFMAWLAALAIASQGIARTAYTPKTQRIALAEFKFWPSVGDVVSLVGAQSLRLKRQLAAARKIAEGRTEVPKAPLGPRPILPDRLQPRERSIGPSEPGDLDPAEAQRSVAEQLEALGFPNGLAKSSPA